MVDTDLLYPGEQVVFLRTGEILTVKYIDGGCIFVEEGRLVVDGATYPYFFDDELEYADSRPDGLSVPGDSDLLEFLGGVTGGSV